MSGRHSRNKGSRSERALRDELIRRNWTDVVRVPLSGAVKTRDAYQDDVVGRPPGWGSEVRFENKARATGFSSIYELLPPSVKFISFVDEQQRCVVMSLDPNEAIRNQFFSPISNFDPKTQKILRQVIRKCENWIGQAQILSLKQDRLPFLFIRFYR
jgi:hypothetical protein